MWTAAGSGGDDKAHREFETAWRRRQRPENEVPISVTIDAVVADGQEAVVFISGARVFSNGVDFTLEVRARHGTNDGRGGIVACHEHGTTLSDFLPASWDHLVASYGTTRRVVQVESSARLFASDVMFVDVEVNSCGVQGGQHG